MDLRKAVDNYIRSVEAIHRSYEVRVRDGPRPYEQARRLANVNSKAYDILVAVHRGESMPDLRIVRDHTAIFPRPVKSVYWPDVLCVECGVAVKCHLLIPIVDDTGEWIKILLGNEVNHAL